MKIRVSGDYALFTRPETQAEPCTYPAITPTAAKGLLESIYYKPEMKYSIQQVIILKPIRFQQIMTNGVNAIPTFKAIASGKSFYATENRTQQNRTYLVDVDYVIEFEIIPLLDGRSDPFRHKQQFVRRVDNGQCFRQPYLGVAECPASFQWTDGTEKPHDSFKALGRIDIGMLTTHIEHENNLSRDMIHVVIEGGVINYAQD